MAWPHGKPSSFKQGKSKPSRMPCRLMISSCGQGIIPPLIFSGSEFRRSLCKGKEFLCFANLPHSTKGRNPFCIGHITHQKYIQLQSRKQHHRGHLDGLWLPVNFLVARRGALLIFRRFTCEALKNQSQMTSKDNNRLKEYCLMSAI